MAESIYEKYAVRKPIYEAGSGIKNRQSPTMTFMSEKQTRRALLYYAGVDLRHTRNRTLISWNMCTTMMKSSSSTAAIQNSRRCSAAEIEFYIGGQPITFNTTTSMYIPKGTPHGPVTWKKFYYPHVQMAFMLGTGDPAKAWGKDITDGNKKPSKKTKDFDYEQYVIRSPMREAGPGQIGRQSPTMTYMSRTQINVANTYIEWGWIYDVVKVPLPKMVHDEKDEIVLHIGGDPKNPEDLGRTWSSTWATINSCSTRASACGFPRVHAWPVNLAQIPPPAYRNGDHARGGDGNGRVGGQLLRAGRQAYANRAETTRTAATDK